MLLTGTGDAQSQVGEVGELPVLSLNNGQLRTYFLQYNKAVTHRVHCQHAAVRNSVGPDDVRYSLAVPSLGHPP